MNLVQVADLTKKTLVTIVALVTLYIIALLLKSPAKTAFYTIFPPKDLPNYAFGLLDPLQFTAVQTLSPSQEFVLNTRTGELPADLQNKMLVYKYVEPKFSFSEGEKAQTDALTLGYDDNMRLSALSSVIFIWQDVNFGGSLVIDTSTRSLRLTTPLANKGSLFPAGKLNQEIAIKVARQLLGNIERIEDKLYTLPTRGRQEVKFGKFSSQGVVAADSIPEAQIARVDFFRQILDFPILGPNPKEGLLQVSLRAPKTEDQFPQLNYPEITAIHWEIDTDATASYPIIPVSTAWSQVLANKGVIANITPRGASPFESQFPQRVDKVLINEIYLAYFDNDRPQRFLQPIYVFEGNYTSRNSGAPGAITVYYPAIGSQNIVGEQPDQVRQP